MNVGILLIFLGVGLANVVLTGLLMSERTDKRPDKASDDGWIHGPSWAWQINVLFYAKYTPRGKMLRRVLMTGLVLQLVIVLWWIEAG